MTPASLIRRFAAGTVLAAGLTACSGSAERTAEAVPDTLTIDGATAADCEAVQRLVGSARLDNFLTQYALAERKWARVGLTYDRNPDLVRDCAAGYDVILPTKAQVLADQGLVFSNQRSFEAARGSFAAARRAGRGEDSGELLTYETIHALNGGGSQTEAITTAERAASRLGSALDSTGTGLIAANPLFMMDDRTQSRLLLDAVNELSLSNLYLREGRLERAEHAIARAVALSSDVAAAASSYVPRFNVSRAVVVMERGRPEEALTIVDTAIANIGDNLRGTPLEARAHVMRGTILTRLGRPDEALEAYRTGFKTFEGTPVAISYSLIWPYFSLALEEMATHPDRSAELTADLFRAAQTVRSRTAANSVSSSLAAQSEGESEKAQLIRAYNGADQDITALQMQKLVLESNPLAGAEQVRQLNARLSERLAERDRLTGRIEAVAPGYFEQLSGAVDVGALQGALSDKQAFVQIIPGEPESMVFLVTTDTILVRRVSALSLDEVTGIVEDLRGVLRAALPFEPNKSHRLYEAFLQPLEDQLADTRELVFSLSGVMSALPMEILATRRSETPDYLRVDDFTDIAWLGARYEVSYTPSPKNVVEFSRTLPARADRTTGRLAAFGEFVPGADPQAILAEAVVPGDACLDDARAIAQLPPLQGTSREIAQLRARFGDTGFYLTGEAFTEEGVKVASASGTLRDYDILHFATHGILPDTDCLTRPALSVSMGDTPSDGLLTDDEIRKLDLQAALIVMSACDTAAPALGGDTALGAGGEGLTGLARAFFDAGSRAVLATHWPLFDEATVTVMDGFYAGLQNGLTMTRALQKAQAGMRDVPATSDPLFWGAFVLVGDGGQRLVDS